MHDQYPMRCSFLLSLIADTSILKITKVNILQKQQRSSVYKRLFSTKKLREKYIKHVLNIIYLGIFTKITVFRLITIFK